MIVPKSASFALSPLQHNSGIADGLDGLGAALKYFEENGLVLQYDKVHKVLGEGNFVLSVSEGKFGKGEHVAFYDLFRLENGQIVEHWDSLQPMNGFLRFFFWMIGGRNANSNGVY